MASYRYIFVDSSDEVADYHVIESETDSQAAARADRLLAAFACTGIEVWDGGRQVYCARKAAADRRQE
jgi:hypothetical protein